MWSEDAPHQPTHVTRFCFFEFTAKVGNSSFRSTSGNCQHFLGDLGKAFSMNNTMIVVFKFQTGLIFGGGEREERERERVPNGETISSVKSKVYEISLCQQGVFNFGIICFSKNSDNSAALCAIVSSARLPDTRVTIVCKSASAFASSIPNPCVTSELTCIFLGG